MAITCLGGGWWGSKDGGEEGDGDRIFQEYFVFFCNGCYL